MITHALVWAAVPHNSDGIVFQIRIKRGLQRFYLSRRVLEDVFGLERRASDAKQLDLFYTECTRIIKRACAKRSIAGADTVALSNADFDHRDGQSTRSSASANLAY